MTCASSCPEPVAVLEPDSGVTIEEWHANMHWHDGCIVAHIGKECSLKQPELPLEAK